MTAGGKDGWPIFVGAYGLIGALYPDQAALVEGLWTGTLTWNDEKALEMWSKMQIYTRDMIESGASGIAGDAAPGRFASGAVAMFPGGTWYAPAIEASEPEFEWGYIPFPGSDNAEDNQYLFGKYDQGWAVAANTPNAEAALLYLTAFSEPENYQAFVNAVGFIPTQETAQLSTAIGDVTPEPESTPIVVPEGWTLVWNDEFEGDTIDEANWTYDIGGHGWGNGEAQFYTDRTDNARIEEGMLVIEARQERYEDSYYTSARLKSQGLARISIWAH